MILGSYFFIPAEPALATMRPLRLHRAAKFRGPPFPSRGVLMEVLLLELQGRGADGGFVEQVFLPPLSNPEYAKNSTQLRPGPPLKISHTAAEKLRSALISVPY
jgi:hypothetical protein